jgi:phage terminase large subunit-like protein
LSKTPNVDRGHQYALDVVNKKIPACEWVILSCQKYLDDLKQSKKNKDSEFYFDKQVAERVLKFKQMFTHVKGPWANTLLILEPWQLFFNMNIFGWLKRSDGCRKYRKALLFVPRKNGKSADAATTGLYMLTGDGEEGAEVFSGAGDLEQARAVFKPAWSMAQKVPDFQEFYNVDISGTHKQPRAIFSLSSDSVFKPIVGNPGDGDSPSCAIVDEYHEHKTDALFDTMETGMGAREQPLMLIITTAGSNLAGPCYALVSMCKKILQGVKKDDSVFSLMYGIDPDDDWSSIESAIKANPNYGVSVSEDYIKARLTAAVNDPKKQTIYKTKHLNQWVGAMDAYFNTEAWQALGDPNLKLEDFCGRRIFIGLDLSSKIDIASMQILIPLGDDHYVQFNKNYLPEARTEGDENEQYKAWAEEGYITVTDGEIIDYSQIKQDILDLCSNFELVELAYDPFQATMLVTELMSEGVPVVELAPNVLNFSEPMKELDAKIQAKTIMHNGDPVMSWMMSNVVSKRDKKDNDYPNKEMFENKIDGPVALIMAINRAMNDEHGSLDDFLNNPISVSF